MSGIRIPLAVLAACLCLPAWGADQSAEIEQLKQQLKALQKNYQAQITALQKRIDQLEARQAAQPAPPPAQPAEQQRVNAFNPAISVILNGRYQAFRRDTGGAIAGFSPPAEASPGSQGFSLGESEVNLQANVDDRFFGNFTATLADEGGNTTIGVEEAWLQTLTLPYDLTLKAGRFHSAIGYMNERHTHTDDFADRPLPYRVFLNNAYLDDGLQLRWLAPTDTFVEFGGELMRGAQFPVGGSAHNGVGAWSLFLHAGDDYDESNSWLAGISWLSAEPRNRDTGAGDLFTGSSDLVIADLVWKWAPNGNPYRHNAVLQGGLFWRHEKGNFQPVGKTWLSYDKHQYGWYAQAAYQFMPAWRVGMRGSGLHAQNPGALFAGTALDRQGHDPWEVSFMVDWSHSEFSRLRLQLTHDESLPLSDDRVILQYIASLGAHGAHEF